MGLRKNSMDSKKEVVTLENIQLIPRLLAYKRFDQQTDYLVLRNNTYVHFLRADGKNTSGLSISQRQALLKNWATFNGQFLDDYEIISTKFPTNTNKQQAYWGRKYAHWNRVLRETNNDRLAKQAKRRLDAALHYLQDEIAIEKKLYNFDFIFVFFGKTPEQLKNSVYRAKKLAKENRGSNDDTAPIIFHELTHDEKEEVLFRLNNPNARMK
ncbi:hypothetical protein HPG02_00280 [Pediococcus pentosaceus]|uniref:hypothetical protein n=1 Tax=Pediococcus pentosaceus TaxID=1255 RepID=UPI001C1EE394|nr:hypothetical protein [Pediococcus pentosaceus]MBU7002075.1 hypothetical protein [Pediococcus pentosaceus]MCG9227432.1 hypothetical protein [Pediococcus pentosaceus]MDA8037491.1 hypothetical protein [Pediococcus pentosaceus]